MSTNPPFERGQTLGTTSTDTGAEWLGRERVFEDVDPTDYGPATHRTQHSVCCRAVRNTASIALSGKRIVKFKAGTNRTEIDGYANTLAGPDTAVLDEHLTGTVAVNDVCWVTVKGPTLVTTSLGTGAVSSIAESDYLVAASAAASTSTTAGRVGAQDLTGATAVLGAQLQNVIGAAMSARTTAETGTDLLIYASSRIDG